MENFPGKACLITGDIHRMATTGKDLFQEIKKKRQPSRFIPHAVVGVWGINYGYPGGKSRDPAKDSCLRAMAMDHIRPCSSDKIQ